MDTALLEAHVLQRLGAAQDASIEDTSARPHSVAVSLCLQLQMERSTSLSLSRTPTLKKNSCARAYRQRAMRHCKAVFLLQAESSAVGVSHQVFIGVVKSLWADSKGTRRRK